MNKVRTLLAVWLLIITPILSMDSKAVIVYRGCGSVPEMRYIEQFGKMLEELRGRSLNDQLHNNTLLDIKQQISIAVKKLDDELAIIKQALDNNDPETLKLALKIAARRGYGGMARQLLERGAPVTDAAMRAADECGDSVIINIISHAQIFG